MPKRTASRKPQRPETDPYSAAFFEAIESSGHLPRKVTAPEAAAGVLGVMLLRLPAGEAIPFVEGLPESVRALLRPFAAERPAEPASFDRDGFLRLVSEQFGIDEAAALRLSRVVFAALEYEMPVEEQVAQVESKLPDGLRKLWRQDTLGA
jgi:uncharacterized protein (DUF2267 family)